MLSETDFRKRFAAIKCFALDLDGTIYLGNTLFPFTLEFIETARLTGRTCLFVTNNSSLGPAEYVEKFARLGLNVEPSRVYTSADATVEYLLNFGPGHRLCVLGTEPLIRFFESRGFIIEPDHPDALVLGFDLDFDYSRMRHACRLLRRGVPFYATHPDRTCPVEDGELIPDCGAMAAALTAATGVQPIVLGKPHRTMVEGMLRRAGVAAEEMAVVGDRLSTDIRTGADNGLLTVLVLTGETSEADLRRSAVQPDWIAPSLQELIPYLRRDAFWPDL